MCLKTYIVVQDPVCSMAFSSRDIIQHVAELYIFTGPDNISLSTTGLWISLTCE